MVRVSTGEPEGAPGLILALQTFGQDLTFHPHIHVLATEGLVRPDDTFVPVPTIDAPLLEHTLRRRVFNLLLRRAKPPAPAGCQRPHAHPRHNPGRDRPHPPRARWRLLRLLREKNASGEPLKS